MSHCGCSQCQNPQEMEPDVLTDIAASFLKDSLPTLEQAIQAQPEGDFRNWLMDVQRQIMDATTNQSPLWKYYETIVPTR